MGDRLRAVSESGLPRGAEVAGDDGFPAGTETSAARGDWVHPYELPRLLDIEGVAEHLGVTVRHVRRLVAERRIPFVKWGHLLRFDPGDIAIWLDQWRREAGQGSIVS